MAATKDEGSAAATAEAAVRAWFDAHGRALEPGPLRHALKERGVSDEDVCDYIDEGADWRRAHPASAPDDTRRPPSNGTAAGPPLREPDRGAPGPVPPQNLEAEESVLGAVMLNPAALTACRDLLAGGGGEFYKPSHAVIWRAALALADEGVDPDVITLADRLDETGQLDQAGGRVRIHELAAIVPATANVAHYARIVAETAQLRDLIKAGGEIARLGWDRPGDTGDLLERARQIVTQATEAPLAVRVRDRFTPGGQFILDQQAATAVVWGSSGDEIAWATGEGTMIAGPQGVGKTTLMQQLALARIGFTTAVLGMAVQPDERKVLYIAADRPEQARRSMLRMVSPDDRELLDERLVVHRGPPAPLITSDTSVLARLADQAGAGTVVIDSLKDVATKLADDDHGGRINLAFQAVTSSGVELLAGHHQRKSSTDNKKPNKLDDVYGSTWITSGLGSVILLWGDPGDAIVELSHLKQPREELGPWNLQHDHIHGRTTVAAKPDLIDLCYRAGTEGLTAVSAAELSLEKEAPTRNDVERVRRRLDRLADQGRIVKLPGRSGGSGGATETARYLYNGGTQDRLT